MDPAVSIIDFITDLYIVSISIFYQNVTTSAFLPLVVLYLPTAGIGSASNHLY